MESATDAGAQAGIAQLCTAAEQVLRQWAEPSRAYHNTEHLAEVLDHLKELHLATRDRAGPVAVLAAWFHDAVYTATPGADERASAELAVTLLTAADTPAPVIHEVRRAVLATIDHQPNVAPQDHRWGEQAALLDADLAILAAAPSRYARYLLGVREEYRHIPDAAFAAGRTQVVSALLGRERLYLTETGHRRWEAVARRNLAAELPGGFAG
ncbi:MAG: hypothetical protein CSA58_02075 [Micrococcales bacterium]|nr:MAG: hypothetical protein CSB46_06365 [Micrococcales bacterium]PIE27848.1 MAG: hypothetical protein CSA58_02075 [Micrococcales bacterium]